MIIHVICLAALGVIQLRYGTLAEERQYRSLGRVQYDDNSFSCQAEGFHADPVDCRTFYRCVDYGSNDFYRDYSKPQLAAFRFECGEGTVFDPDYNVCNHPRDTRRVECGGRQSGNNEGGNGGYPQPNPPFQGGGNGYPQNPNYNYGETNQPQRPENPYGPGSGSENQFMTGQNMGGNQTPLGTSENCQSEGFFPVKGDCKKFIRCVDNGNGGFTKFEFSCGPGTVWDPVNTVCNYPSAVPGCEASVNGEEGSQPHPIEGQYPGPEETSGQGYPGSEGRPGQGGYPGSGGSPGQGGYPGSGGSPGQGGYPGSGGSPGQGGYPGSGGSPGQGGYPGSGGSPGQGGYPGSGGSPGQGGYPGSGGSPGQGGYPGSGGSPGQGGYPGSGGSPGQGGYPGSGGSPGQGGYPGSGGSPGQGGYPGSGGSPGQGGYPGSGGSPGQGGYPGSGGSPGQGGYPGSGGSPGQGGYPGSGGSPGQGGYPGSGGSPGQGGYPGSGENGQGVSPGMNPDEASGGMLTGECNSPGFFGVPGNCKKFVRCVDNGNGGYIKYDFECGEGTAWDTELNTCNYVSQVKSCGNTGQNIIPTNQENRPEAGGNPGQEGGYPGSEGRPGQGGYPGSGGSPGQGGYPGPGGSPGQGGYPGPGGSPGQGGYPGPGGSPGQGGYPGPGGSPGQGGYPGPGGSPGQGGYPGPGGSPGQGGYPGPDNSNKPDGSNEPNYPESPNNENMNPPPGNPSECQGEGFHPVQGACERFFRCVNNGNNGYLRYDFQCGEGTVWDQENQVCNYPWAVARSDNNCNTPSSNQTSSPSTGLPSSAYPTNRPTSPEFTTRPSMTMQTQTTNQWASTPSSQTQTQTQSQRPQTPTSQQTPVTSRPDQQSSTQPMTPQGQMTTEKPEMPGGEDPSKPPPGSSPCNQNKLPSGIKCDKAGFFPDPSDCRKFYRCVDWDNGEGKRFSIYYFECGKGTIWDPSLETCNHETAVYPPRDCQTPSSQTTPSMASTTSTKKQSMQTTTTKRPMSTTQTTPTSNTASTPDTTSTMSPQTTSTDITDTTESTSSTESTTSPTDLTTTNTKQTESTTSVTDSTTEITDATTPNSMTDMTTPQQTTGSTESTTSSEFSSESNTDSTTSPTDEPTESSTSLQTDSTTASSTFEPTEPTESSTSITPTTESAGGSDPNCPQLNEDQSAFVCPTGFRRHPKDCNLFYQCTTSKDTGDINVMILSCKNNTVYDERKIQCLPPEETDTCQNKGQGRRFYRRVEEESFSVVYVSPNKRLCPSVGSFSYEGDCTRFYKCKKDGRGKIQGYLYQCPENYSFSESSKRCEKTSKLPKCTRSIPEVSPKNFKWMKSKVPMEYFNLGAR